ncbi:peptide-methionine (S)-S-oxide reductase, partial [Arthrospira platensis SPKY1]|nr:peptide-methionine (S)-S-oxide reductase [Arthrospira platensis SPKY1]
MILFAGQCSGQKQTAVKSETIMSNQNTDNLNTAIFAGGCFWCTEAVFQNVKGVYKVESGYIGGTIKNPAYREITTGRTGHAEAIRM